MSNESTPPFVSRYPELSLPPGGWKSTLPEHLLEGADPQTLFIMHELSKNSQATDFACRAVIEQNAHLRALNGKTYRNERGLAEIKGSVDTLTEKAAIMEPLFKPLSQFMALWEYRLFRWGCYIVGFFLLTYALPFYLQNPLSLSGLWSLFTGP
jgi:hypothetical protein